MQSKFHYRDFLNKALDQRRSRNPSYTVGSFGRLLGFEASRMGQILNGKVGISVKRAHDISDSLKLSEYDKKLFILSVQAEHERNPTLKKIAIDSLGKYFDEVKMLDDVIASVRDWYHHAIIEYLNLPERSHEVVSVAKYFGISEDLVISTLERLENLELIKRDKNQCDSYEVISVNRRTGQDIPSEAVKQLNEQMLEKAGFELRNQDIANRDYSILYLKLNKEQLAQAKEKIRDFRRDFLKEFESSPSKDSIYAMNIQFFELGNKDK